MENLKNTNINSENDINNKYKDDNNKDSNKDNIINNSNIYSSEMKNINKSKEKKFSSFDIYNNNNNNYDNKNKINEKKEKIEEKEEKDKKKLSIEDFEVSFTLGKGSYAKVVLAKNKNSQKLYALKIIDKKFLKRVN